MQNHAIATLLITCTAATAQDITPRVTEVAPDYTWGYRSGIKQPAGHWRHGRGVHNLSRETGESKKGSPDYLVWVDSHNNQAEIIELGHDDAAVTNPGGQAAFNDDGSIVYVLSGRADELAFDMLEIDPVDWSWSTLADDFITYSASTTPCVSVLGDQLLHAYRYAGSAHSAQVAIRAQRWSGATLMSEMELARGGPSPYGNIGLEQLWTCNDPRYGVAMTWQWWSIAPRDFGSCPFVWTADGQTWNDAAGNSLSLPLRYGDIEVPYDHVALGDNGEWQPRDIGWTPGGVPFLTGRVENDAWLWRWVDGAWSGQMIAGPVLDRTRSFAVAVTRDYLVALYATAAAPGDLYAVASADDGETWTSPVLVDTVTGRAGPGPDQYRMISIFHPARYLDNGVRVLVTASDGQSSRSKAYENTVRFVELQVGPRADFDGDGGLGVSDVLSFFNVWASGDWRADFEDDGDVDEHDANAFLAAFWAGV